VLLKSQDKIKIGDNEYLIGTTEQGEKYLLKFDEESKKEIKIVFSNEDSEGISNEVIKTLSQQYINRTLMSK